MLNFPFIGHSDSGKTRIWAVFNGGIALGSVAWWPHWRRYTLYPHQGTTFDSSCLREIADFLDEQTQEHNEELDFKRHASGTGG
jgi:hypothetical protein